MLLRKTISAILWLGAASLIAGSPAFAEEDCFNGPVPVDGAQRAQFTVPAGHAARLTFNFNAAWENMVYVCDALTGHRILEKGNYNRNKEDWVSPIDNTNTLSYFIVDFHKTVPQNDAHAFQRPWLQSALKRGVRVPVDGQGGAYVDPFGFNDGGGISWENAVVTVYVLGAFHTVPGALPATTLQTIRSGLHAQ